jgi:uncharacterized protein YbjT (DUF2867 family)
VELDALYVPLPLERSRHRPAILIEPQAGLEMVITEKNPCFFCPPRPRFEYLILNHLRTLAAVQDTFHSVHVESARQVAAQAQRAGVERLVHISGIGANPRSQSLYIRKRGEGELAVRGAFANALLIRPAVMFGPDDAFLTTVIKLLKRLPIYPMFGRGRTRLQPVYVEDVAKAAAMALQPTLARPLTFECGGPHVYSYEELLRAVAHEVNVRPMLVPEAWKCRY